MKKVLSVILFLAIAALVWYLFINPYDYRVSFKANTFAGAINQTIKTWDKTKNTVEPVIQEGNIYQLKQQLKFGDSLQTYHWKIEPIDATTSLVKVGIKDENNSLLNRITTPFKNTDFEKRTKKELLEFNDVLAEHIKIFKVKIEGEEELGATSCACVSLEGPQMSKANGMMQNYNYLSSLVSQYNIELNGRPFIQVNNWDMQNDNISYDFCFPIIPSEDLPEWKNISYKKFYGGTMLKAIYNGNYITSDRAWYALLDYAEKNNIAVESTPIEFFYNNPNMGVNETSWKAEVYLPLKADD